MAQITLNSSGVASNGTLALQTNGTTTAVTIDTSQNVGIGTSSPSGARVQIVGDNSALRVGSGTRDLYVDPDGGGVAVLNGAAQTGEGFYLDASGNTLRMLTSSTERMRIDSSGNLLVGTTSAVSGASLAVANSGGQQAIAVTNGTNVSYFGYAQSNGNYITGAIAGDAIIRGSNGVSVAGNNGSAGVRVASGGTSWTSLSDERHKNIIETITDAAVKVASLRAVIGRYKTDDEVTRRPFLIAQDVQSVLPEAVNTEDPDALALSYTDTIPLLVAAIQEQQAIITQLQADVAALKGTA